MAKRGLSLEEKRKRMLDIFYESKTFYNLKELEKIAPKEKGITQQSVKDVVQALVDDGYVDSDKIGTSIYFWALPSKGIQIRKKRMSELEEKVEKSRLRKQEIDNLLQQAQQLRQPDNLEESERLQKQIADLKERRAHLQTKVAEYKDFDPEVMEREKKEIQLFKDSANRWTDNIFSARSWMKSKFGMEESAINGHFKISEEMDYID